ncbi:MAG: ribosomal protein S18-alanine N-acetyltransferase [Clostridia bacterium]|nr:ribosomal protein S18-alanine N-acetyltransferase [Clostridia bacterium]
MNIEIRKIDAESAKLAAGLEKLCFSEPWSEKAILEEAERGYFVAAYIGGAFAGYAGMTCVLDERDVCNVATVPEFRGMGVGKALVASLIESARNGGASVIMLEVRKSNAAAIALYEKAGFTRVGERKNFYTRPREDALLYNYYIN